MIFFILYIVLFPVVWGIVFAVSSESMGIGDYLVGNFFSALLWTFVPATLLSIFIDVYKKQKNEEKTQKNLEKREE